MKKEQLIEAALIVVRFAVVFIVLSLFTVLVLPEYFPRAYDQLASLVAPNRGLAIFMFLSLVSWGVINELILYEFDEKIRRRKIKEKRTDLLFRLDFQENRASRYMVLVTKEMVNLAENMDDLEYAEKIVRIIEKINCRRG